MSASFLITWERLPARSVALAIYAGTIFPVWQPVRVGTYRKRTTRSMQIRLPNVFRILSARYPSSQGRTGNLAGTVERALTPAHSRAGRLCRYPFTPAATWELKNFGRPLDGWSFLSALVQPAKQPSSRFFDRLVLQLLCSPLLHAGKVAKESQHDVQKNSARGARNYE